MLLRDCLFNSQKRFPSPKVASLKGLLIYKEIITQILEFLVFTYLAHDVIEVLDQLDSATLTVDMRSDRKPGFYFPDVQLCQSLTDHHFTTCSAV